MEERTGSRASIQRKTYLDERVGTERRLEMFDYFEKKKKGEDNDDAVK